MRSLRGLLRMVVVAPLALLALGLTAGAVALTGILAAVLLGLLAVFGYDWVPWNAVGVSADTYGLLVGVASLGVILAWILFTWRRIRGQAVAEAAATIAEARYPDADRERHAVAAVEGLAEQLGRAPPAVRILDTDHPLCYTVRYPVADPPGKTLLESDVVDSDVVHDAAPDSPIDVAFVDSDATATTDPVPEAHVVVVSTGLLGALSDGELRGVLAHELAHVANGDLGFVTWLLVPLFYRDRIRRVAGGDSPGGIEGSMLVVAILAEWFASIAVGVFTRGREFSADRAAARLTGDPAALATALERLSEEVTATPATDMRTVGVLNVLPSLQSGGHVDGIPASHPPTAERIERLRAMARDLEHTL